VSDPLAVRVDVRGTGVAWHIPKFMMGSAMFLWRSGALGMRGLARGRGPMRRYVAAAHMAAMLLLFVASASFLSVNWNHQS